MAGSGISALRIPSQARMSLIRSSEQQGAQPLSSGIEAVSSATLCVQVSPSPIPEGRSEAGALLGTWYSSVSSVSAKRGSVSIPRGHSTAPQETPLASQAGTNLPSLLPLALSTDCPGLCPGEGKEK